MSHNQTISSFRRSPYFNRRKQIDHSILEPENHIQSIGDTPIIHDFLEQIIIQPTTIINHQDYLYMIYLLLLMMCYIYYMTILFQGKRSLFEEAEEYDYLDNSEREIPRLLWFKKGYQLH